MLFIVCMLLYNSLTALLENQTFDQFRRTTWTDDDRKPFSKGRDSDFTANPMLSEAVRYLAGSTWS